MMQFILAAMAEVIGTIMGGLDGLLYSLIVFVGVDYATGVMVEGINKACFNQLGFRKVIKKIMIFCMVALAHTIDNYVIRNGSMLRTAVILFYLSNEGISILDNATHVGLPIPKKLKVVLEQIKESDGNEGE
ncbi:holin family protein [Lacrimispora sp.]|uniref:phage holin family protein n=1 Tax=Lacrimispora sp. TaxID=2719234 RepID=UPI00345FF301